MPSASSRSHADWRAEFRNEVDCLRNLADDDMAGVSVDLLRGAADTLDALLADLQRLEEALRRIADPKMECLPDCIEGPPTCGCEMRIAQAALREEPQS